MHDDGEMLQCPACSKITSPIEQLIRKEGFHMAQQRGMKRAEKVLKRKRRIRKTTRENNLKLVAGGPVAKAHAGHDHAGHDHADHAGHDHEHDEAQPKTKKKAEKAADNKKSDKKTEKKGK